MDIFLRNNLSVSFFWHFGGVDILFYFVHNKVGGPGACFPVKIWTSGLTSEMLVFLVSFCTGRLFAVTAKLQRIILVMPPLHPIFFWLVPPFKPYFWHPPPHLKSHLPPYLIKNEWSLGRFKMIDASFNKAS